MTAQNIQQIRAEAIEHLEYAETLIARRARSLFIRHDGSFSCDFAGHLLVSIIDFEDDDGVSIYIQDADDWALEFIVESLAKANEMVDELFGDQPILNTDFLRKLRKVGFDGFDTAIYDAE